MKSPISSDEFDQIRKIQEVLGAPHSRVTKGIGDDAAILTASGAQLLLCSDACVESIHFRLDWTTPRKLGYKAVVACASDIAAMNGQWLYSTISLALPKHLQNQDFIGEFYEGVKEALKIENADVVGGDLTASPGPLFIDITCVGESKRPIRRSGAYPGDWIMVGGKLGSARAGFEVLNSSRTDFKTPVSDFLRAHLEPKARFDLIQNLDGHPDLITSMIDVSDGLSSELHHLANASALKFQVREVLIPHDPNLNALAEELSRVSSNTFDWRDWILNGGEDYQLLATMNPNRATKLINSQPNLLTDWTRIGEVYEGNGVFLQTENEKTEPLVRKGFRHF